MSMQPGQKVYSTEIRPYETCQIIKVRKDIGRYFAEKDVYVTVFEEEEF